MTTLCALRFFLWAAILLFATQPAIAQLSGYDVISMTELNATCQPSSQFMSWDVSPIKYQKFSWLHDEPADRTGGLGKYAHTSQEITYNNIPSVERKQNSVEKGNESPEKSQISCSSSSTCKGCISIAGILATGPIFGCADAFYLKITTTTTAATNAPQRDVSYFLATSAFIQCAVKPLAGFVAAMSGCLEGNKWLQ